jgi:hypothetical protein
MRLRLWATGGLLAALVAVSTAQGTGSWTAPLPTDKVEGGINWSTGFISAKGMGVAPPNAISVEHGRALAIAAATVLARQELLAVARGVAIDATTTVQALMVTSSTTNARISGVIRGAQVVDVRDVGPGVVEVTVAVPATGEFADLVIPHTVVPKPAPAPTILVPVPAPAPAPAPAVPPPPQSSTQTPGPAPAPPAVRPPAPPAPPAPSAPPAVVPTPPLRDPSQQQTMLYSGLVVDARGLGIKPAMAPKVLSEAGQEVYGGAVVDRNWVIQHGMAGYSKDLSAAQAHDRVTNRPLTVKAVSASGATKTDVVISNRDAQLLIASGQHLAFLEKARVMFVVD